ncbi:SDR family NAD(P)-dependent oxidoreductase [Amycolatopsis sp. NPDC059021]|uniref:SDR family NAD(P)-dependent oxidoreductase n=1 Tax=Amycolatopsis sp. NPDC059021 TaxID=3346704 RepID=UPI003670891B
MPVNAPRTALVTGANRGIGHAVARALHRRGHRVVVTARDDETARRAAAGIGADVAALSLDVTDVDSVGRAARLAGPVDMLVCNAGVLLDADTDPVVVDLALVERTFAVNLLGTWRTVQAFLPGMLGRGWGRVVFVSSGTTREFGQGLFPRTPGYSLSKAAVNGLTTMLAAQVAGSGVLVNAVNPGRVRTRMMPGAASGPETAAAVIAEAAELPDDGPNGRFLRAADFAKSTVDAGDDSGEWR